MKRPLAYCSLVIALLFFSPRLLIADDTIAGLHAKAEAGDSKANFQLGMSYANGDRVKKDFKQAAAFYLRAATKGMPEAQFNLAALYFAGDGVPKDLVMAYVWWSLCGATGNKDAKEKIASLESQMTLEQKAQAMTAAREIILRTQAAEKTANPAGGSEAKQLAADPVSRTAEKKPLTNASTTSQDVTDPQRPKSRFRPTLTARYPGTSNIGPTAVDVRWSNHGAYLQRMIEGVQTPRFSVNDLKGRIITLQERRRWDCGFEFSDERIADWRAGAGGAARAVG